MSPGESVAEPLRYYHNITANTVTILECMMENNVKQVMGVIVVVCVVDIVALVARCSVRRIAPKRTPTLSYW